MQHFFDALPTVVPDLVPADVVAILIPSDIFGRRLKWKVGNGERDVAEKRFVGVLLLVLLQEVDRVICNRYGRVIAVTGLHGRKRLVVERVMFGREVVVVIE